jgi:hypothetical protein
MSMMTMTWCMMCPYVHRHHQGKWLSVQPDGAIARRRPTAASGAAAAAAHPHGGWRTTLLVQRWCALKQKRERKRRQTEGKFEQLACLIETDTVHHIIFDRKTAHGSMWLQHQGRPKQGLVWLCGCVVVHVRRDAEGWGHLHHGDGDEAAAQLAQLTVT